MKRSRKLNRAGFTLIELTAVAAIFVLFAAMASSRFKDSFDSLNQETAFQDIMGLFAYAHERAILEGVDYGVHLAPEQNACWLIRAGGTSDSSETRVLSQWGTTRHWPDAIRFTGSDTSILFYPDGTATPAELVFMDHARLLTLSIDPVTGKGSFNEG